jgi:hypothetical protein
VSSTISQQAIFEATAGFSMSDLYWLLASIIVALYALLMLKIGRGALQGFSLGKIDGYELLSRAARLFFLFNILLYLVSP